MLRRAWVLSIALALAACGGGREIVRNPTGGGVARYVTANAPEECVPYARAVSGIQIKGDAWTWWDQADGVYGKGSAPRSGAVLVLGRSDRLSSGHISVVVSVRNSREITVSHTNWGNDGPTRRRIYREQSVIDVSSDNDWTAVRFWNPDTGAYGGVYESDGFVYPASA